MFIFLRCNEGAVRKTPLQMCAVMLLQPWSSLIWTYSVLHHVQRLEHSHCWSGLLSALYRACLEIKNNKGVGVGPCVAAPAPNMCTLRVWYVGPPLQSALIDLRPWMLHAA